MFKNKWPRKIPELLLFSLILGGINLLFPLDIGFLGIPFNPYLLLAFVFAAYYGKYLGYLSLGFSIAAVLALPLIAERITGTPSGALETQDGSIALAVAVVGVYLFGIIHDAWRSRTTSARSRLRELSRAKGLLQREHRGALSVIDELEERVSRQSASLSSLSSRIQDLDALNLEHTLDALLEIIQRFTGAETASIWEHDPTRGRLRRAATVGRQEEDEQETYLPVEGTIEGWVLRNNMLFSVKMLLEMENLRQIDRGRNLLTVPISVGRRVWGILNIEKMPFTKYNLYTEKLLIMILTLASPALETTVEYETIMRQADIDEATGLSSFGSFYSLLDKEIKRVQGSGSRLSVVLAELVNYDDLAETAGHDRVSALIRRIAERLSAISQGRATVFGYRNRGQLGVLYPDLDYDGASFYCLQALSAVGETQWLIEDEALHPELLLGYAAYSGGETSADELLDVAENLLAMQRL
jgi:GGDEF domain-containing protein